ncbi:MAG: polysaccharide deacetylase family protein [Acidobacteriota bacterium]
MLKTIYKSGALSLFHQARREQILILMYHRFSEEENPFTVSRNEFSEHLKYLKRRSNVVSLDDAIDGLAGTRPLAPNTTVITIDDGYHDAFDIAFPLVKEFGFPATLFAVTDFLDRKLWVWTDLLRHILLHTTREHLTIEHEVLHLNEVIEGGKTERILLANELNSQLKQLPNDLKDTFICRIADVLEVDIPALPPPEYRAISWDEALEMEKNNVQIEAHTVTHPILPNIDSEELKSELVRSKRRIECVLNKSVNHFCYPNGAVNEIVHKAVRETGYKSAVTTQRGAAKVGDDPFSLKRIGVQAPIEYFAQSVSGFEDWGRALRKLF